MFLVCSATAQSENSEVAILSTAPTGSCKLCDPSGYRTLSGTSMATPHVSGTGAFLMSRGLTAAQVRTQTDGTPIDLGFPGFDFHWLGPGRRAACAGGYRTTTRLMVTK